MLAGAAVVLVLAGVAFALPFGRADRGLPAVPPSGVPSVQPTPRDWPPAFDKPGPALTCTPSALPEMAGTTPGNRAATAMDPTGQWIVGSSSRGLLVWHNGKVSNPSGGQYFVPHAVDAAGAVAGYEVLANKGKAAAVYRNGRTTRLELPPDTTESMATDMDAHGNVLGDAVIGDRNHVAVLWPASGGMRTIQSPPELTSEQSSPTGPGSMNDDGVMLGWVFEGNRLRSYRWNLDGTGAVLDSPTAQTARIGGDWVAGEGMVGADLAYFNSRTFGPKDGAALYTPHVRWNMRTGTGDAMGEFQPMLVSASGRVFGVRDYEHFGPAVWSDGTVTSLPTLTAMSKPEVRYAGISADGRTIVASTRDNGDGPYDITKWTC